MFPKEGLICNCDCISITIGHAVLRPELNKVQTKLNQKYFISQFIFVLQI